MVEGVEHFHTTHWSVVLAARDEASEEGQEALQHLCRTYWYPLYIYVRRRGHSPEDAQDLTQEFFAQLLKRHGLERIHPEKGKFRSFLLASMNHFLANEWDRRQSLKRGGGCKFVSVDDGSAEAQYLKESVSDDTAESLFDRRWAITLLEQALARLRNEWILVGKGDLFEKLKEFIPEKPNTGEYGRLADELKWKRSTLNVTVHRLRQRYSELVREEVAHTLDDPGQVNDELRDLLAALR